MAHGLGRTQRWHACCASAPATLSRKGDATAAKDKDLSLHGRRLRTGQLRVEHLGVFSRGADDLELPDTSHLGDFHRRGPATYGYCYGYGFKLGLHRSPTVARFKANPNSERMASRPAIEASELASVYLEATGVSS